MFRRHNAVGCKYSLLFRIRTRVLRKQMLSLICKSNCHHLQVWNDENVEHMRPKYFLNSKRFFLLHFSRHYYYILSCSWFVFILYYFVSSVFFFCMIFIHFAWNCHRKCLARDKRTKAATYCGVFPRTLSLTLSFK